MSMTEDTESGEVTPFEAIGEAAGAAFQQALSDGANPADAFTAAAAAATEMADVLGITPEIAGPVIEAAKGAFDSAIDDGVSPAAAFRAAGDAAGEIYGDPLEAIDETAGIETLHLALGEDEASTDISALGEGGDNPLDIALGGALDGAAQQGGAPAAGGAAGAGSGAAGADIAADEVEDEETDQAQVDDGGGG